MSFPILCAINFVAYKTALRRYIKAKGGNWDEVAKIGSLPVCVNGDDILFKANKEFFTDFWQPAIKAIGFSLSLGKNYFSAHSLPLIRKVGVPWRMVAFRNLATSIPDWSMPGLTGPCVHHLGNHMPKCPGLASSRSVWTAVSIQRAGSSTSTETMWSHTKGGRLNLFAKVEQGGLGISLPPGIEPGWTWFQKALAHHLRHKDFNFFEECEVSLGAEMNSLLGLPEDFVFKKETEEPPCQSTYVTPRPAARSMTMIVYLTLTWRNPIWRAYCSDGWEKSSN